MASRAATTKKAAFRASCTNGTVPFSTTPSPAAVAAIEVASASHEPSAPGPANDAASPPTTRSSQAFAVVDLARAAASSTAVTISVATSGDGKAARPISSTSAATAIIFMPAPPADSGTASAVQPSSTICRQMRSSHASGWTSLS